MGTKPNRIVSFFLIVTVAALLMATPLMSLVTAGASTARMSSTTVAEEDLEMIVAEDTSQIQGLNPALEEGYGPTPIDFDVEIVQDVELGDLHLQNRVNEPLGGDGPSPTGTPYPEPMDAPFLTNDVLVYNDAVNSEKNVSLAKTSNGTLYVAYDHDIGTGLSDVYVSKSTDGGITWVKRDIAVDAAEDESCPTIAGEYSPNFGTDVLYVWYNNPTLEFAWSMDGDTWNIEDFGGGITWWQDINCPYVDLLGDSKVIVAEIYDTNNNIDTFQILYTIDGMSWTTYYFIMWPDAWVYQPRVAIQSVDMGAVEADIVVTMTVQDRSDPNPANWHYDAILTDATITSDLGTDSWGIFYTMSAIQNLDLSSPDVAANDREVIFTMSLYNPGVLPLTTMYTYCLWAPNVDDIGSATWNPCAGSGILAFDPSDVKDQKYTKLYREDNMVHAVWLNETDIYYMLSPNGGADWIGPPMKVNDPSSSTALDAYHSPDVTFRDGRPCVAWHDSRGNDNIYFQTFETERYYEIRAEPKDPNIKVREIGDSWHPSPYYYLWGDGSSITIEATPQWTNGSARHNFQYWSYDISTNNPETYVVSAAHFNNTAVYGTEFYLMMNGGGGTTNPASGWYPAYTWVTVEAFPPVAPPGGRYLFMGWSGDLNNFSNPCIDCVYMDGPKVIWANWSLQWNVTITTDPVGFLIYVNGVPYSPTPQYFWFNDSEIYNIFAPSPIGGPPIRYVFSHWSNGGNQSQDVSVTSPAIFTAYYNDEFWITLLTNPPGLNVRVNLVEYVAPYSF
ncbi:MAG: exo-alpha-sialidase, partial [Methanobacteriota archaeon]